jgi:type IV pilus assembly protein PilN
MIRINLLPTERAIRDPRRSRGMPAEQKVTIACSLILVLTGVGVLGAWWSLDRGSAALDGELLAAQRETARLKTLLQQVDRFDQQKQQLQQRVGLIEELRTGQSAAVHIVDQISRALPDMLWLTEMKQDKEGDLTIEGRCATLTSLSDLVGNLERSGYFKRPVEILDSQVEAAGGSAARVDLIKFAVKAQYALPGAARNAVKASPAATQRTAARR